MRRRWGRSTTHFLVVPRRCVRGERIGEWTCPGRGARPSALLGRTRQREHEDGDAVGELFSSDRERTAADGKWAAARGNILRHRRRVALRECAEPLVERSDDLPSTRQRGTARFAYGPPAPSCTGHVIERVSALTLEVRDQESDQHEHAPEQVVDLVALLNPHLVSFVVADSEVVAYPGQRLGFAVQLVEEGFVPRPRRGESALSMTFFFPR